MPRHDFTAPRLFLRPRLASAMQIALDRGQTNYLVNVLRLKEGDEILVFNGADGEWRAKLVAESRRSQSLLIGERTRPQPAPPDLQYLFAPL